MSLINPTIWDIGEEIKSLLENLPAIYGTSEKMFSNVTHGLVNPEKQASDKFPLAQIVLPMKGAFKSSNGLSVDYSEIKLPVYGYFHEENPEKASKMSYRFIQLFAHALEEMNYNWIRDVVTVLPEQFELFAGLKNLGSEKNNSKLHHPFHGVKLTLNVRINDSSL